MVTKAKRRRKNQQWYLQDDRFTRDRFFLNNSTFSNQEWVSLFKGAFSIFTETKCCWSGFKRSGESIQSLSRLSQCRWFGLPGLCLPGLCPPSSVFSGSAFPDSAFPDTTFADLISIWRARVFHIRPYRPRSRPPFFLCLFLKNLRTRMRRDSPVSSFARFTTFLP